MPNNFRQIDLWIIQSARKLALPLSRLAIFIIFFWFGILKILEISPADSLVEALLQKTLPFISADQFIIFLGLYEMFVGLAFLVPDLSRLAIGMLAIHMLTTFFPLIILPRLTWQGFLAPTLDGQYIIKNLIITALAISIAAYVRPYKNNSNKRL